jgi:excisionase family DNA binding protein
MVYNAGMSLTALSPTVLSTDVADINSFPMSSELTVAQAAAVLDVPEGYVDELIEDNLIEYRQEGNKRWIDCDGLLAYKEKRERGHAALDELLRMFHEAGLSDDYYD